MVLLRWCLSVIQLTFNPEPHGFLKLDQNFDVLESGKSKVSIQVGFTAQLFLTRLFVVSLEKSLRLISFIILKSTS